MLVIKCYVHVNKSFDIQDTISCEIQIQSKRCNVKQQLHCPGSFRFKVYNELVRVKIACCNNKSTIL